MFAKVLSPIALALRPLYQFVYPPTCLACNCHLSEDVSRLCSACRGSIRSVAVDDDLFKEMNARLLSGGDIAGLVSAFHFEKEGTLQSLIHQLKYEEMTSVGIELGKQLGAIVKLRFADISKTWLVPVPLHPHKKRERGYNQSDFVAKGISSVTGMDVLPALLKRKKNTKTQTKLNREERKENMNDAFELNSRFRSCVPRSSFILVDDVITTGATIQECARILRQSGAAHVFAASIALADHAADGSA